ncbi:MAG: serine/threonine-protein kinase [Roseiflexaceae bacterium]
MSIQPPLIGTRLGAYDIQALLGSGGMANVYRAFDTNLHRAVAIKVLSPAAAAQPGFADRFRQEARLIANLRHPNIVQVYDFGEQDGHTYMVQELLAGPTLADWMADLSTRSMRPTPDDINAIISQLAGALDAAHAAGIIHRDVKPGNALWNEQGQLVLTDFGIAKHLISDTNQTQFGVVFGTPSYLSPEQAQTLPLTPATDVYSLGVMLYELLAGDVPFHGATPMQVAMDHIQTAPPPLSRPDLPPEVAAVVLRALAKDPAARFASAGELAQALATAWVASPTPLGQPGIDIHNQATQHWQPPVALAAAVSTPSRSSMLPIGDPLAVSAPPAAAPHGQSPQAPLTRSRSLLPVLGALLAIVLLAGVVLAMRSRGQIADTAGRSATSVPADAVGAITALPTSAPAQQSTPINPTAPVPGDAFDELRISLETGRSDGRVGLHADELLAALSSGQQTLAAGDTKTAAQHFTAMQQMLLAGTHDGTVNAEFMVETMKRVQSLATSQGLTLPLSIQFN